MNVRELLEAFDRWRASGEDLVLATVYATEGSTYSKAGAQMLIDGAGHFQGMLSGGCLEGDLAERAAATLDSGAPQAVSYDLGNSDEELWGLGVGCDGLMRIFLQPLAAASDYAPFAAMADTWRGDRPGVAATVIESAHAALPPGSALVVDGDGRADGSVPRAYRAAFDEGCAATRRTRTSGLAEQVIDGTRVAVLYACLLPPPRILLLGGGLDVRPVVRLARALGWRVTVQDHRPAYIEKGGFDEADLVLNLAADDVAGTLELDRYAAAVVMSHHLQTDRRYLAQLADSHVPYIGLLGPVARRRRLLADLGAAAERLAGRVHGPAGLDLGGRGPAAIALSIVSELHRHLHKDAG